MLDPAKRNTGFYAEEVAQAHNARAAAFAEPAVSVKRRFPLVLTTNSGYPLDQNFSQTVKGISAATRIVEKGGVILIASRCNLGLPPEGDFATILAGPCTDADLRLAIQCSRSSRHDQRQVQTLPLCLEKARVLMYSELSHAGRPLTRTEHCDSIEQTLTRLARESAERLREAIPPPGASLRG